MSLVLGDVGENIGEVAAVTIPGAEIRFLHRTLFRVHPHAFSQQSHE
jgi:hypothetical protein